MPSAVIALANPVQRDVLAGIVAAHGLRAIASDAALPALRDELAAEGIAPALWIVGLDRLRGDRVGPSWLIAQMRGLDPDAILALASPQRFAVTSLESRWAHESGAAALLPNVCVARLDAAGAGLAPVFAALSIAWRPESVIRSLAPTAGLTPAHRALLLAEQSGWPLPRLAEWARSAEGFELRDRTWRGQAYPDTFVGAAAVDRLSALLDCERSVALAVGDGLYGARTFAHAARAHPLRDGNFFYRFTPASAALQGISPRQVAAAVAGRGGFACKDRVYGKHRYAECFVGSDAVDWLVAHCGLAENDAATLGQALMDLGVIEHVTGGHAFRNGHYFYHFTGLAA